MDSGLFGSKVEDCSKGSVDVDLLLENGVQEGRSRILPS